MLDLMVLAVALALDAAAVSAALGGAGVAWRRLAVAIGLFAVFQAGMAAGGAWAGAWIVEVASSWDHWLAWGVLTVLGVRMAWVAGEAEAEEARDLSLATSLALAVATSLDALAAGLSLPLLPVPVVWSVGAIGAVTLLLSAGAAYAGRAVGAHFGPWVERAGGVALVAIGARILVEHLGA